MRPIPVGNTPGAFNSQGEVLVTSPARVWDRIDGTEEELPTLSGNCSTSASNLNEAGTVVGQSRIKVKGQCTGHAVIWTQNGT